MSKLEEELAWQLRVSHFDEGLEREWRFHVKRRWRFDFAWPGRMLAVECEGHGGAKSRHLTYLGYTADCEKYNEAALLGWLVLRFTGPMIASGEALEVIERAIHDHKQ